MTQVLQNDGGLFDMNPCELRPAWGSANGTATRRWTDICRSAHLRLLLSLRLWLPWIAT